MNSIEAAALAPDVCEPVYAATPTLVVAVSSAIASATSAARAAPATRNPEVLGDYPVCAVRYNLQHIFVVQWLICSMPASKAAIV